MKRQQLIQVGVLGAIVVVSVSVSFAIQRRASAQLKERDMALHRQNESLAARGAENEHLSNLVGRTRSTQKLSQDELRELMRLRGQAGLLRESEKEKGELMKTNSQLRAAANEAQKQIAEAQAAPNYWAKDQLAPAGYGDPESTVKTMLWAAMNGDVGSWRSSCTPHAQQQLEAEWKKHKRPEVERMADLKQMGSALTANATGFRVLGQEMHAEDEAAIKLQFVGEGKERQFILKKIDNQWKFHDLLVAGQERQKKQFTARAHQ